MSEINGSPLKAIGFLKRWPAPPTLTAIHVDPVSHEKGLVETKSFWTSDGSVDWIACANWVAAREGRANLYFAPNPPREPLDKKAEKTDIDRAVALYVDIDVPAGEEQEKTVEALIERVRSYKIEPTKIIATGGGVQPIWIIQDPVEIGGDVAKAAEVERYGRALEADFEGADHCHNVDRILRLPFTTNVPDAKKIAKGRKPAVARVVHSDGPRYPLAAFPQAASKSMGADIAKQPKIEIDWDRVPEHAGWLKSLADLPEEFPRKGKIIVEHEGTLKELNEALIEAGLLKTGYGSWSSVTMALAAEMKGYGKFSPEKMAAGLMASLACNRHVTGMKTEAARRRAVHRALNRAYEPIASSTKFSGEGPIVSEWDHMARARLFVEKLRPHLHHYRGDFTDYGGGRHAVVEDDTVKAEIYGFLDRCGKVSVTSRCLFSRASRA